jgi:tripartite-type tricarboxylate transporter receptor subunit TctC
MRKLLGLTSLLVALAIAGMACAETAKPSPAYPARTVRVIVPYPPGGMDVITRVITDRLSAALGVPFYVENLPGAGSTIGIGAAARAPADGATLLVTNQDFVIQSLVRSKVPYDPDRSFRPVTLIARAPETILVNPFVPAASIRALLALLKTHPGEYSYATPGYGTAPHLACERLFRFTYGLDVIHVPFQGVAPAITSTIAGHTQILHVTAPLISQHVQDGTLRALAVAASRRSPALPDVPTLAEAGVPNHEVEFWMGVMVPAGTPDEVVNTLHTQIAGILALPDVKAKLDTLGFEPVGASPRSFATHIQAELAAWRTVVQRANIRID